MPHAAAAPDPTPGDSMDEESRAWIDGLTSSGTHFDDAVARLHALLLRMSRAEASRRTGWYDIRGPELEDLAAQAADDATVSILRTVTGFRGESRFTTWACAFAIHEVSNKFARHAWRRDGVRLDEGSWDQVPERLGAGPEEVAESRALVAALTEAVDSVLTPHQRRVFVALVVDAVPVDVLALELDSSRNALYKTMFDCRRKLRLHLETHGYLEGGGRP